MIANADYHDHHRLAEQFMMLMDGATATALRERSPDAALRAKAMATALLEAADREAPGAIDTVEA